VNAFDPPAMDTKLTHVDGEGRARMVNVGEKPATRRRALARCRVTMAQATVAAVVANEIAKGDVLSVARIAGIQAAKRTSDMIPLCHPLMLTSVNVEFQVEDASIVVESEVEVNDRTGVEMEALHACSVAALTIYDMCKAIDKDMVIGELALWEKSGGRSGEYRREG
jgi:cyclic pyranopterin phosphate synthase